MLPPAAGLDGRGGFPVVGVGASAGGLAATIELVRQLGPSPGLAVVVIHHLDPVHESGLGALLARVVAMPVRAASDGLPVEVDHVYVMPPQADLVITGGALHLLPRAGGGLHLPIDRFFESLAADLGPRAVGVVLSGTGADGSLGVAAIKRGGGATFAQDGSAEYHGMPQSAVATGHTDLVLPLLAIAFEVLRLAAVGQRGAVTPGEAPALGRILAVLQRSTGIEFVRYKQSTIVRRVRRRMGERDRSTLGDYADLIDRDADEATLLGHDLLIHVTRFFRDPETFALLGSVIFPRLVEHRPADAGIRVWAPGCSTGEEVYSLAICLLEFLGERGAAHLPLKVFGTDVSEEAITASRLGRYAAGIERDVSPERLERFFGRRDAGYQIRQEVRELCVFARHDATRDPPFAGLDLISCRNLLIYLGPELQDRLLAVFHYALREPGFLVLGSAEGVRAQPGFVAVDDRHRIYARTSAAPRALLSFPARGADEPAPQPLAALGARLTHQDFHREADRLVLARFSPPGVVVTDDLAIVEFRGRTGPFLEPAPGAATFDLMRLVREELRSPLRLLIEEARARRAATRMDGLVLPAAAGGTLDLQVIPFEVPSRSARFFLILFEEVRGRAPAEGAPIAAPAPEVDEGLARELASTRDYLESLIERLEASNEELKAANEEIVSSNEELRSTNEELQMAKEELQASNQELGRANHEARVRTAEAVRTGDDLSNVLRSVEIPILLVGPDRRLRRFTPAAARRFHLDPGDLGRPLAALRSLPVGERDGDLDRMIGEVGSHLTPAEATLRDADGRWYQVTVRPYLTRDSRIDGTVITAIDVDALRRAAQLLGEARAYAESVVDTIAECLVVVDEDLEVRSANRAFRRAFQGSAEALEGRRLQEVGPWSTPELVARLGRLGPDDLIEDLRVELDLPGGEQRAFVARARRIEGTRSTLLALEEVTEEERAQQRTEQQLRLYQGQLQQMAFDAALTEEQERRRIAADLHDRIGQSLALAQIKLAGTLGALEGDGASHAAVAQAVELIAQSVVETRSLIVDLSPPVLYDLGLVAALSWLAEDIGRRDGTRVTLVDDGLPKPLDDGTAALLFRAVRELLLNVHKHAGVADATVSLRGRRPLLEIEVADRGAGFDASRAATPTAQGGFGLFSVRERLSRLGGSMTVISSPQEGTRVTLRVPLRKDQAPAGGGG